MNYPNTILNVNTQILRADIFTPVSVYLKLRDLYRDAILLEATDFKALENCWSFICLNPIAGFEITNFNRFEFKRPNQLPEQHDINPDFNLNAELQNFMNSFSFQNNPTKYQYSQGLYGYFSYETIGFWEHQNLVKQQSPKIPITRFRLYKFVIAFNHFNHEMILFENALPNENSELNFLANQIANASFVEYQAEVAENTSSNISNEEYLSMVQKGIHHCLKGDVFQIVLSRSFQQKFKGDDFDIYRKLRSINPSPFLFYFDYGNYRIFGSSPEAQIIVKNNTATIHPIAGTFKRTGNEAHDNLKAAELLKDEKELAEHIMLVDLARNDLSVFCHQVDVVKLKQIQYYSHVIHIVSEVKGHFSKDVSSLDLFSKTFPAGTLSGAPKIKAMQLINALETTPRGFYSGSIGFLGCDGSINQAIMIRTALSQNNTLTIQAGAGIVAKSNPESELNEVNTKLQALKNAML
ncbi:MAG: anthranilate synthase component I family protein [Alphaproteobacteria bacterium]|nr:anthranilate synthase component I family protein [Alphaproteobacteria bacterium]